MVSVAFNAPAAGDYAALDIISNSVTDTLGVALTLANVVSIPGEVALLDRVVMVCSEDSVTFRPRLHFYNYMPIPAAVEMDDNIAADFAKTAAGAAAYLGKVDLPAFADMGTAMAETEVDNLGKPFKCAESSSDLFVVVQTLDADTAETAAMRIRLDFYFLN